MEQLAAASGFQWNRAGLRVDSCNVQRAESVPDALDYAAALDSVQGMNAFARAIREAPQLALRDLAMGRQVAECLGSPELAAWCATQAERVYRVGSSDDPEYARYQLARMDIAELIPLMDLPGHMGWHVAARLAEFAFKQPDTALLDRCVHRLYDFAGVDPKMVDPQLEAIIADASLAYLLTGKTQSRRLGEAIMRAAPEFRQRAMLDLGRLYMNINYGEAA